MYYNVFSINGVSTSTVSNNSLSVSIYTDGKLGPVKGFKAKNKMDTTIDYNSAAAFSSINRSLKPTQGLLYTNQGTAISTKTNSVGVLYKHNTPVIIEDPIIE